MIKGRMAIRRLLLLNWRGVFFQPFDFARGITALEGHNGAGKTTVMVALFVALMPDLRLLSFRNVGESVGESDKGLYGRLGHEGPAYTLVEFVTPEGEGLWAGVMLTRHGEPRLDLTPFLIEGLADDLPLDGVFLRRADDQEFIPTLTELKEQVALAGGALRPRDSVTAYLGELYERGVLPLPLANHDERERYHRVLATSMMGGLSAFIQKGLRDYLLPEDVKLRSHVGRMRENLDACRMTRRQIQDARVRYESIRRVYDAGWGMLTSAFHGTRLRAKAQRHAFSEAMDKLRRFRHERDRFNQAQFDALERHRSLLAELETRQAEQQRAWAHAENARRAHELARQIESSGAVLAELRTEWENLKEELAACEERHAAAYRLHDEAQASRDELAARLADAQVAFESLHRRVAELRAARRSLEDVRQALPGRQVEAANAPALREECEAQWRQSLDTLENARQAKERHDARKRRFDAVLAALERLAETGIETRQAPEAASHWDGLYRERMAQVRSAPDLQHEMRQAEVKAARQRQVRERAAPLGLDDADSLRAAMQEAQSRQSDLLTSLRDMDGKAAELRETVARCGERLPQLESRLTEWQAAQQLAAKLSSMRPFQSDGEADVAALERQFAEEAQAARDAQRLHEAEARRLETDAEQLAFGGGRIDESLVSIAEQLGGQLLIERYEDVDEAEAASLEARLGPLAQAIVVEEPLASARQAEAFACRPDTVWFVSPEALPEPAAGEILADCEIVQEGARVRLSRRPERPVIGRPAREREIERLKIAIGAEEASAETEARRAREAEAARVLAARLAPLVSVLGAASPAGELEQTKLEHRTAVARLQALEEERVRVTGEQTQWQQRAAALADLAPDSALLDAPVWADEVEALGRRLTEIREVENWLERHRADWEAVQQGFQDLLDPPHAAELQRLADEARDAQAVLDGWTGVRELLRILCERLPALQYEADEALLAREVGALAGLRARQREIEAAVEDGKWRWDEAQRERTRAQSEFNTADAGYQTASAELDRRRMDLNATGLEGTRSENEQADVRLEAVVQALKQAGLEEREADKAVDRTKQQLLQSEKAAERQLAECRRLVGETRLVWRQWVCLKKLAGSHGSFARLSASSGGEAGADKAFRLASEYVGKLTSILGQVEAGAEVLQGIDSLLPARGSDADGARSLLIWMEVRRWIDQRLPRDVAQAHDPEQALAQIHDHLSSLESRLAGQESNLRQRTEEVANSIASKIRREEQRLQRINQGLADVCFGAIRGVRLNLTRLPTFQALLDALRGNADLFAGDMPLEVAMAQLFEQVGGGRIRGEQLLDYREYLRLTVQIRRIGKDGWADARGLSTGESIGVGASILIVILDAWEHQAALLRGRRAMGSLRFLFLDEATRLDADALDTLTDFCERVGVQLLVAAPGLERARRGHVYSLVRMERQGEEVVLVRGRKWAA